MISKHKCAVSILLISISGLTYAFPTSPDGKSLVREVPGISIPLYLPLKDGEVGWFRPLTQNQLFITPTVTRVINNIQITSYGSTNGSCGQLFLQTELVGTPEDPTVTLSGGHTYHTTDASNWAFFSNASADISNNDLLYQFRNGTTNVGNPGCIAAGGSCTSSSNCGWSATRTWAP